MANDTTITNIDKIYKKLTLNKDGAFLLDGKVLDNKKLAQVFDYTKYQDTSTAKIVEGVFKSKKVIINDKTYPTTLNSKGQLISTDGTTILEREKIEKILGPLGYNALVCKTTKDVTITDQKITIKDKEEPFKITIPDINTKKPVTSKDDTKEDSSTNKPSNNIVNKIPSTTSNNNYSGNNNTSTNTNNYNKIIPTSTSILTAASLASPEKIQASTKNTSSNEASILPKQASTETLITFSTAIGNNDTILVDFDALDESITNLSSLKTRLSTVSTNYRNDISSISTTESWSGADKDHFVTQKSLYASNIDELIATLDSFITCLETYKENYLSLENTLSAKTIS